MDFDDIWDSPADVQQKQVEQNEENFKCAEGIPEFSLLFETDTNQNNDLTSSVFSEYETSGSGHGKRLYPFLLHLLENNKDNSNAIIRWEDRSEGLFRICSLSNLAVLWGKEKNNSSMDHNKLRRALRYIIDKRKLLKVDRHIYKFITDFKENQYMKSRSSHQPACKYASKEIETTNSTNNSPLTFSNYVSNNEGVFHAPVVLTGEELIKFDICHNDNKISEATDSISCVDSTGEILYCSNNDMPNMEHFSVPSVSDSNSSLSFNDLQMSVNLDFSLKPMCLNSDIFLPELSPPNNCLEIPQNVDFIEDDFLYDCKTSGSNNDEWLEHYTGLSDFKSLDSDTSNFEPMCFEYDSENESCDVDTNLKALLHNLHQDIQFLNNA